MALSAIRMEYCRLLKTHRKLGSPVAALYEKGTFNRLLVAQSDHWIDLHRAQSRQIAGQQRHNRQHSGSKNKRQRIGCVDSPQEAAYHRRQQKRSRHAHNQPGCDEPDPLPENQAHYAAK